MKIIVLFCSGADVAGDGGGVVWKSARSDLHQNSPGNGVVWTSALKKSVACDRKHWKMLR
jgi:hypothetical protein